MSLLWIPVIIYGFGVIVGSFITIAMAIDEDWKFSQIGLCLIWPLTLVWVVFFGADIRGWFERHWG